MYITYITETGKIVWKGMVQPISYSDSLSLAQVDSIPRCPDGKELYYENGEVVLKDRQ